MHNAKFKPHRAKRGVGFAAGGPAQDYGLRSAAGRPVGADRFTDEDKAADAARLAARDRKRKFVGEVR